MRQRRETVEHPHPELPAPELTNVSQQVLAQGESLVIGGDAARQIPACRSCHGAALTGMEPGIPGLLGLRPNYISAQLGAFRYGTRTAKAPDCMQTVAARLTEADVTAVAASRGRLATLRYSQSHQAHRRCSILNTVLVSRPETQQNRLNGEYPQWGSNFMLPFDRDDVPE